MLDLLFDPSVIALLGTVGGGITLKSFESRRTRKKVTRELQGEFTIRHEKKVKDTADPTQSIYACKVYSDRLFEHKLVEAGVLSVIDMTTCDVNDCLYCKPTRDAQSEERRAKHRAAVAADIEAKKSEREKFLELKRRDGRYSGYRFEDYDFQQKIRNMSKYDITCADCGEQGVHTHTWGNCDSCGIRTMDAEVCKPCQMARKQKSRPKEIVRLDNGVGIKRPKNVPSFATAIPLTAQGATAPYAIWWQWSYPDSGLVTYRQEIATETIEVTGDGVVTRRIESVYDPDSGEHLGEIEVGKSSTGQSWTKILDNPKDREIPMLTAGTISTEPIAISPDGVVRLG